MGEKLVVGPINQGLVNSRTAFVIDNDSFPVLQNAYQWRGRIKRKRGTSFLCRLTRFFDSTDTTYTSTPNIVLSGSDGNLVTGYSLEENSSIVPGSVTIIGLTDGTTYTDPAMDGTLLATGGTGQGGTITYSTGAFTITAGGGQNVTASFEYYPSLPVMGIEDFAASDGQFPGTIAFDTKYSYKIQTTSPYSVFAINFYKNPAADGTNLPGYTPKTIWTQTTWNGEDYQQFWTTNFQGALWATNGIEVPFDPTNVGMQFKLITGITIITAGNGTTIPAVADLTINAHGLVQGDFIFVNEVGGITGINFQTGYVTSADPQAANLVRVTFPFAILGGAYVSGGIAQYLTNRSDATKDCIRWYDGDPTNDDIPTTFVEGKGWVNFCPPISQLDFSIADLPADQYYLVGCRIILPFKDRLIFMGVVVQSSTGLPIYLQDTVIYSQNGTPYYTSSFTNSPNPAIDTITTATTVFNPILTPIVRASAPIIYQTGMAPAYFADSTGFGGFITAGLSQPIITASSSEDVLILGFDPSYQVRFVYTGNDIVPFNFYIVNSELGSSSTFSATNLDTGVISRGPRGYIISNQESVQRIDLAIPDEVFEIKLLENGNERVTSQRDFINEWIYFTYPSKHLDFKFPGKTLQYNYRDNSWGIFFETYTTYGMFRRSTGYTWATIGAVYAQWNRWTDPWNAGTSNLLQPEVVAGNQQGFIVVRDEGTNESKSLMITNFSFQVTITNITQAASAVVTFTGTGNFFVGQTVNITDVAGMTQINGGPYTITVVTPTTVTLSVNSTAFTAYASAGTLTPNQTVYCSNHCLNDGDYILITGALGTISTQVNGNVFSIYNVTVDGFALNNLTPTSATYFGEGYITRMYVPLVQSKQFPVAWSLGRKTRIGVQQYLLDRTSVSQISILIFLSQDADNSYNDGPIVPDVNAINNGLIYSQVLYTCPESTNLGLTAANSNQLQLNAISSGGSLSNAQKQIWHRINTSLIGDVIQIGFTMSDAQMRDPDLLNQFAEIVIHGFILDISPSSMLS